jgi:hypothetical protein
MSSEIVNRRFRYDADGDALGIVEVHPRTFSKSRKGNPTAQRTFIVTPDVTTVEPIPTIGEVHPDHNSLTCVKLSESSGFNNDPEQVQVTATYEVPIT